jgi:hypothetical protein
VRRALFASVGLVAVLSAAHLAIPLASLPRKVPLNYGEGWNGYQAVAVLAPARLYPGPGSLFPNNYPPLSFYLMAGLGALGIDPVIAGRMVSMLSLAAIALLIGFVSREGTGSAGLGAFAGLLFVAILASSFGGYVGTDDPQLLAHALMLGSLTCLIRGHSRARVAGAVVLMGLGGLAKHNLVALPLAVTIWLAVRDRTAFRRWVVGGTAFVGASLVLLLLVHGTGVLETVLSPRPYSLERVLAASWTWLSRIPALLVVGLAGGLLWARAPEGQLPAVYALIALALGLAFAGGAGVNYNAIFDLLIALSILAALLLGWVQRNVPSPWAAPVTAVLALALCAGPLGAAPETVRDLGPQLERLRQLEAATERDVRLLGAEPAPVLCETNLLCFWAGQPPEVDLFNTRQAFRTGAMEEELLLGRLRRQEFSVVQLALERRSPRDERVSPHFMQTLGGSYRVDRRSRNGVFFRPR